MELDKKQRDLFIAVKDMIYDADIGYRYEQIVKGLQNTLRFGENEPCVSFQELYEDTRNLRPVRLQKNELKTTITENEIFIQLDFLNDNSDNAMREFELYLKDGAVDFLINKYPYVSIGKIQSRNNLTGTISQGIYQTRNTLRLSLFMRIKKMQKTPEIGLKPIIKLYK
ncbi:hypothetical protein [Francisella tularensis]|uniref:hypothetical protein n=1 Tax=Francisella tularensis TaxID=263 RepID=UPI0008F4D80F|nr:hypothetical protein [Francisella tularensis]APA83222.1 hypothetical protein N894_1238 [Francisella tularensis subsp. novicida PA10-7858]